MLAAVDRTRLTTAADCTDAGSLTSIDLGFRWIDDITVEFAGERPNSKLQLKVSADIEGQKFEVEPGRERTISRVSNEKIPCGRTKEIVVELFEYKGKFMVIEKKVQILSMRIALDDDELYTEKTYTSDDNRASITIKFAYTPGGELREHVEIARRITEEQKVILDKVMHIHRFFKGLESVCEAVGDIHPYIKAASTAVLSLYKLCEKQEECRDAARGLVDDMSDLLNSGVEKLSDVLRVRSNTKTAFKSIVSAIEEISEFVKEQKKGIVGGLRIPLSSESKIKELREKFKRAKAGLNDSITYGLWELAVDDHLKNDLKFVSNAYYQRGAGCLTGTRVELLAGVDMWVRDPNAEKMAWIHGYAGSGKSALLNSIARNMEKAYIPFTCFTCKRDDAERSDVQRILSTICYGLTRNYGDYRGKISDTAKQQEGISITTGDVATQMELLFGESPSYEVISPRHARRPPVHVLLIDALDECKNIRERNALARHLRELAERVPWIKVIITSRPESDIANVLAGNSHPIRRININDERWKTSADIHLFVEAKSKELKLDLSPSQVEHFEEKASGLFIWCTTVFRYIEESKKSRSRTVADVLKDYSPGSEDSPHAPLYSLYQHVLDSAVSVACDEELMETILGVVFVSSSRRPLSATAITDILFPGARGEELREKREWVANIIKSLFAIIYIEEGGTNAVRACHLSVLDYIGGMLNGKFASTTVPEGDSGKTHFTHLEDIHERVFTGCFTNLALGLRFNFCELEDPSRLNKDVPGLPTRIEQNISEALQYGCLFWVSHLEWFDSKRYGEQVFAFLNSLMALYWIEALSLLDAIDQGIVALQDCVSVLASEPGIADIANEWERFLLAYGDATKSTPHLYLSALQWIPVNSRLWDIIHSSFSSELPLVANMPGAWKSERWSENVGAEVKSVAYSPDGRLFAVGCLDGSIRFWEARSRKKKREPFTTESGVQSIAFAPDSRWLASGHDDNKIRLWNLSTEPAVPRILEGHAWGAYPVAISSDGKKLVSGSRNESIRVWDVESGTAIGKPFHGHSDPIKSVVFSADGTRIISGSDDWTVRIWNVETCEQIGEKLHGDSVASSRDGRFIASGSYDENIRLWDAHTYKRIGVLEGHTGHVNSVCFSFDSKLIVSGSDDLSVRAWNAETHSLVSELREHTSRVVSVTFSPDGRSVLSGSEDGTVRIWDIKETAPVNQPFTANLVKILCVSYIPCSNRIVSGSRDGSLIFWDAHTGAALRRSMQGHSNAVNALAVSHDGQWLVSGSSDSILRIWDIAYGTTRGKPMHGHAAQVNSVAVSPDNQLVASASDDKSVRLWNVSSRESLKTFIGHAYSVTSLTFTIDGNKIISGSWDETIRIWDIITGEAVGQQLKHSHWVRVVAVSPDGQWLASGSWDATVRVWNMTTLSEIHVLKGHFESVSSVVFSSDSRYLVSGSDDSTVRVWNVQSGQTVGDILKGHTADVCSVAFAPDGLEFASASDDGTIRVWDTRAHCNLNMQNDSGTDTDELDEEGFLVRWNRSRTCAVNDDGWIKDQGRLLLWVPWQFRHDIKYGTRLIIGAQSTDAVRPQVNYRKMFRYGGTRWRDIYTNKSS